MSYLIENPNMTAGIGSQFLPLKYTDGAGPIIVALEKSAITFEPPGSYPENEEEWRAVTDAVGPQLAAAVSDLAPRHDITRSMAGGISWRHLDLTAEMLRKHGTVVVTQAHWMLRNSRFQRA
jgi:hypothetical protein